MAGMQAPTTEPWELIQPGILRSCSEAARSPAFTAALAQITAEMHKEGGMVLSDRSGVLPLSREVQDELQGPWAQVADGIVGQCVTYGFALVGLCPAEGAPDPSAENPFSNQPGVIDSLARMPDDDEQEAGVTMRPYMINPLDVRTRVEVKRRATGPPIYRVSVAQRLNGQFQTLAPVLVVEVYPPGELGPDSPAMKMVPVARLMETIRNATTVGLQLLGRPPLFTEVAGKQGPDDGGPDTVAAGDEYTAREEVARHNREYAADQGTYTVETAARSVLMGAAETVSVARADESVPWSDPHSRAPLTLSTNAAFRPPTVDLVPGRRVATGPTPRVPENLVAYLTYEDATAAKVLNVPAQRFSTHQPATTAMLEMSGFKNQVERWMDAVSLALTLVARVAFPSRSHVTGEPGESGTEDFRLDVRFLSRVNPDRVLDLFERGLMPPGSVVESLSRSLGIPLRSLCVPPPSLDPATREAVAAEMNAKPADGQPPKRRRVGLAGSGNAWEAGVEAVQKMGATNQDPL